MSRSFIPLFLFCVMGCQPRAESYEPASPQHVRRSETPTVPAPGFTLTDLNGRTFSLSDFRGDVVFIDFWATWCPPCVLSAPAVDKLAEEYEGRGVQVIKISLDDDAKPVRSFIKNMKMKGLIALAGDSGVDYRYHVSAVPSFFLIDQKGNVVNAWSGYHPSLISQWKSEFDRLLKS